MEALEQVLLWGALFMLSGFIWVSFLAMCFTFVEWMDERTRRREEKEKNERMGNTVVKAKAKRAIAKGQLVTLDDVEI